MKGKTMAKKTLAKNNKPAAKKPASATRKPKKAQEEPEEGEETKSSKMSQETQGCPGPRKLPRVQQKPSL
ncbi:hypothetical protein NDU88_002714 [Pleurodeles waltl]|uniref:High mobility group nucleosome-binding domain-containing protein 3 n=1 Tax=Pleurodeles waltl TaxID=8319 RepID=A0AAV7TNE4_PLEWA|nr:hypothetical protein NDU88_002714 [Pleurodeles waltl]